MKDWKATIIITVGLGLLVGIVLGFLIDGNQTSTGLTDLSLEDQLDITLIFAESFLSHQDFDRFQRDISAFKPANPAEYVMLMTERAITTGRPREDVCVLVNVSARYGYLTDAMGPYLDCLSEESR